MAKRGWRREDTRLADERHKARVMLLRGDDVAEVAREVGVHRTSVHRWLREDEWSDVREARELAVRNENADAVAKILPVAWQCIMDEIASGDAKVALAFAEKVGALAAGGRQHGMAPEITATPQGVQIVIQQYGDNAQNGPKCVDNAQDVEAEVLDCDGD